jgi:ABC-type bacteriocin/lantibiotic exporter with double-glycine peptidase domain
MSEVECGFACLTMILNYHGCGISLPELRMRCGIGRDGLSALEIVRAARLSGHLRIDQVGFRYSQAGPQVLHGIDLTAQPGERIAIVGPSGSGKGTLGNCCSDSTSPQRGTFSTMASRCGISTGKS